MLQVLYYRSEKLRKERLQAGTHSQEDAEATLPLPIPKEVIDHPAFGLTGDGGSVNLREVFYMALSPRNTILKLDFDVADYPGLTLALAEYDKAKAAADRERELKEQREAERDRAEAAEKAAVIAQDIADYAAGKPAKDLRSITSSRDGETLDIAYGFRGCLEIAPVVEIVEKENLAAEERRKKAAAELEADRAAWIKQHGSERLKLMLANGYELRQTYESERGEAELPGFTIDAEGGRFDWKERGNPSLDALREERALSRKYGKDRVEIVWVTNEEDGNEFDYGDFEPYEALRVLPEWSRYNFLKKI